MKGVSFSLTFKNSSSSSKKPTPKTPTHNFNENPQSQEEPTKEFLTEFDPSKSLSTNSQSKTRVIPPKPNEWQPLKKFKNLHLPIEESSQNPTETNLQFEPEKPTSAKPENISYGLNLRQPTTTNNTTVTAIAEADADPRVFEPIDRLMVRKLREDLDKLPEDQGFEEFDDVPVEGFGAALLKGYGWVEGRGIGKNHKEDVKIVQLERRAGKEGIGFVAPLSDGNDGDGGNGVGKKKEKRRSGVFVGKDVRVVVGREMGSKGKVVEVMGGGDYVVLIVLKKGMDVKVKVRGSDVADLGSVEEERCLRKLKELKLDNKKKDSKRNRDDRREEKSEKWVRKDGISWLVSNIRVRIISKELKGGRLYLKKGKVVDVVGPTKCDISMDDSRELIQGVDQELLETALPRSGGPVLVLYGKHKGAYGSLLEKDMDKETAVVQDADTRKPLHVLLEQIAEYIGDPSDIGY